MAVRASRTSNPAEGPSRGDGAGRSAQRGTSGAATGPGGRSHPTRRRTISRALWDWGEGVADQLIELGGEPVACQWRAREGVGQRAVQGWGVEGWVAHAIEAFAFIVRDG